MQPKTSTPVFFFWVAMPQKEYWTRKKNTLINSAASQRKPKWMSLNADSFNLFSLTIVLRAHSGNRPAAGHNKIPLLPPHYPSPLPSPLP